MCQIVIEINKNEKSETNGMDEIFKLNIFEQTIKIACDEKRCFNFNTKSPLKIQIMSS